MSSLALLEMLERGIETSVSSPVLFFTLICPFIFILIFDLYSLLERRR